MSFDNAPKLKGVNLVTGGGSRITDPLGIFTQPKIEPPPLAPAIASPPTMPIPDDDAAKKAASRRRAAMVTRGGRLSTILTDNDKLGA